MQDSGDEEDRTSDAQAEEECFAEGAAAEGPADEREEDDGDEKSDHCGHKKSVRPFSSRVVMNA